MRLVLGDNFKGACPGVCVCVSHQVSISNTRKRIGVDDQSMGRTWISCSFRRTFAACSTCSENTNEKCTIQICGHQMYREIFVHMPNKSPTSHFIISLVALLALCPHNGATLEIELETLSPLIARI